MTGACGGPGPQRGRGVGAYVLVALLLAAPFIGCLGTDDPIETTPPSEPMEADGHVEASGLNPWQAGLDDTYPTPDVAVHRSADERRANVAPPGDPEFAAFDATMQAWMEQHDIPTGQLAIMKDGELRYERGYGHTDQDGTEQADATTMMRIASISKPMVARVVAMMVEEERLGWDDPVFCLPGEPSADCVLPIDPHPDRPVVDDRLAEITVAHLRDHTSGWATSGPCNDPIWTSGAVQAAETLGVSSPAPAWRTVQWLMGAELDHDPGSTYEYCNAGYITLGVVAEALTGASLDALLEAYLFRPLELTGEIEAGATLPEDRNPREPFYACDHGTTQSVFDPDEEVCWADGGWSIETQLGNGGIISTASAILAVVESLPLGALELDLGPARAEATLFSFSGSMPGTRANTMLLADDGTGTGQLQLAFAFNTRIPSELCGPQAFSQMMPGCDVGDVRDPLLALLAAWGAGEELMITPTDHGRETQP